jgi:hypothetical protein
MRTLLQPAFAYVARLWTEFRDGWDRFWFTPVDPTTICAIRVCTGLVLLYIHLTCLSVMPDFLGPDAWFDQKAVTQLKGLADSEYEKALEGIRQVPDLVQKKRMLSEAEVIRSAQTWWSQSVWMYVKDPTGLWFTYGLFLVAIFCFTFGLFTRTANVIVWIGHLSYVERGYTIWFGMDAILAMLLLYMLIAPTGATLSLDRLRSRYRAARQALGGRGDPHPPAPPPSWLANVSVRMIQIHMCIVYLCAGFAKLQGATWWSGNAGWMTMSLYEFQLFDTTWLFLLPDPMWQFISNFSVLFTIAFEVGFIFLIWNRTLRPLILFAAFMLHVGIGFFMGLGGFGAIMLTGCLAFVSPDSVRWFLATVLGGPKGFRFGYDRKDPVQLAAAGWVLAADPWRQVEVVESHDAAGAPPGTLITPEGTTLTGLAAFGRLLRAVRPMLAAAPTAVWPFLRLPAGESRHVVAKH